MTLHSNTDRKTLYIVASLHCGACQGKLKATEEWKVNKLIKACGCGMPFWPRKQGLNVLAHELAYSPGTLQNSCNELLCGLGFSKHPFEL